MTMRDKSEGKRGGESDSESEEEEPPPSVLSELKPGEDPDTFCKLCFRPAQEEEDGLKLGPLYSYGYCRAHLYCLMFSSGLDQNGEDEEGIKGFLTEDIVKEWRRGSSLKCTYCKKKYATIGCVGSNCKKSYHLPCGLQNGSLQQFFGSFASYCQTHRPVQVPLASAKKKGVVEGKPPQECGVCLEELEEKPSNSVLWTPCCGGWFHRDCVERMAATAGCHFFKCPLCNNSKEFSDEMQDFGIYLPDQDAEWETEEAFGDQLARHDRCDAPTCVCPEGPKHDVEDTAWEIMLCVCCGHQGIHIECGKLDFDRPRWKCSFCKEIVRNLPNKPISVFTRVKRGVKEVSEEKLEERVYARKVFENLTFRIGGNSGLDISVDLHKNRVDPKDRAVTRLKVRGVPVSDIPLPVKVHKEEVERQEDIVKNIPCPWEECQELLSRMDFKAHCQQHREEDADNEDKDTTETREDVTIVDATNEEERSISPELRDESGNDDIEVVFNRAALGSARAIQMAVSPEKAKSRKMKSELSEQTNSELAVSGQEPPNKKRRTVENVRAAIMSTTPGKRTKGVKGVTKLSPAPGSGGKQQSSILSFFTKFRPKEAGSPPAMKSVEKKLNMDLDSSVEELLDSSVEDFPVGKVGDEDIEKNKESEEGNDKVITSNVGFFKLHPSTETEDFENESSLERHKKTAHGTGPKLVCQFCRMSFTNLLSWKTHENSHQTKVLECVVCEKEFSSEKALEKHRIALHSGIADQDDKYVMPKPVLYCDLCDYSCKYKAIMDKHKKSTHEEPGDKDSKEDGKEEEVIVVSVSSDEEDTTNSVEEKKGNTNSEQEETFSEKDEKEKDSTVEMLIGDWD